MVPGRMASRFTVEEMVESIIECGDDISLEDIHIRYGYLARKEPTDTATEWMIKLQSLAANKFGENTIPGIYRLMDISKSGNTEQIASSIKIVLTNLLLSLLILLSKFLLTLLLVIWKWT
ncbi:hypothetical protein AVEN_231144-1 [Araneus ventricosus]|uniref:Uncharacterized protein n=1 Tax=Araneus ventricosus TaxID=182803 RepID=A0A4Y2L0H8_ARAVE|nr:hypothetical protein AVEN_231144-1 [Araneus ventricosus]